MQGSSAALSYADVARTGRTTAVRLSYPRIAVHQYTLRRRIMSEFGKLAYVSFCTFYPARDALIVPALRLFQRS
nr:hypothetical protein CFP56_13342 [Quercus suber]